MDASTQDHSVRELSRLTLTLRNDLVFKPQRSGQDTYYVIEDPVNSKFHRVGLAEYTLISLLDGHTTVGEAVQMAAKVAPDCAFAEHEAASICKWLVDSHLAHTPESLSAGESDENSANSAAQRWQRTNPVFARIPLVCPDRYLNVLQPWVGWIHAPWAIAVWFVLVIYALYLVAADWDRFSMTSQGVLAPGNWLGIGLSCLALKFLHEVSHGLVCNRYGGTVREAGVMLLLMFPIPYIDATSSWRFSSKWARIQTAAAGMYVELLLAAVAVILWDATAAGLFNQICYNVAIVGSIFTLAVNANPLMRFDGYYILSDLVEIPNLHGAGQEYMRNWARRHLLGADSRSAQWSRSRSWIVPPFAVAAFVWRIVVCAGLIVGASVLFHGAGLALSCLAVGLWVGMPAVKLARFLYGSESAPRPQLGRLAVVTMMAVVVVPVVLLAVPWPGRVRAPAVVEYEPLTVVRAASSGFVREMKVRAGQHIEKDQVIAILENPELTLELADLELGIEQSQLQCRAFKRAGKLVEFQEEEEHLEELIIKRHEKKAQVEHLTIRAEDSGKVIGRQLASRVGTYLEEGTDLLMIGDETSKGLKISVAQEDVEAFKLYLQNVVDVQLTNSRHITSQLDKLEPQANLAVPHPALSAAAGGPLAVRARQAVDDSTRQEEQSELLTPRFNGDGQLTPDISRSLRAGQLATVTIRPFHESIGGHLYQSAAQWLRRRVRQQPADHS